MTKFDDKMAELNTAFTAIGESVSGVQGDVTRLMEQVNQLPTGDLTPAQEEVVNAVIKTATEIKDKLAALDGLNTEAQAAATTGAAAGG